MPKAPHLVGETAARTAGKVATGQRTMRQPAHVDRALCQDRQSFLRYVQFTSSPTSVRPEVLNYTLTASEWITPLFLANGSMILGITDFYLRT